MRDWDMWIMVMVALFLIVIVVMATAIAVSHEKENRQVCNITCQYHNMTFLGLSGGRCVCSPGTGVRFYFEAGDNKAD